MSRRPAQTFAPPVFARPEMEIVTARLKPFLLNFSWLDHANQYAADIVDSLKNSPPISGAQQQSLADYIAASVSLHASDGWSYLGRAVSCMLAGDAHRALHMGYYAELRAAMSLLASSGLGIFDHDHFNVRGPRTTSKFAGNVGTHTVAWKMLEWWSQQQSSGALFAGIIRPEGRALDEWFYPIGGIATFAPQAQYWLTQWGLDLQLAVNDRKARNKSSYRPDGLPTILGTVGGDSLEFIREMWRALEPSSTSSFDQLDRYILRIAVEKQFAGSTGTNPAASRGAFKARVKTILQSQSLSESAEVRLENFLLRNVSPDDPSIFSYSTKIPQGVSDDVFSVLSRAVLLLRLATGSAQGLLKQAGFGTSMLSFWWTALGEARGLWPAGQAPSELSDLWADIEDCLLEISQIEGDEPAALQSIAGLNSKMVNRLGVLSTHERVGLWGLCPHD